MRILYNNLYLQITLLRVYSRTGKTIGQCLHGQYLTRTVSILYLLKCIGYERVYSIVYRIGLLFGRIMVPLLFVVTLF